MNEITIKQSEAITVLQQTTADADCSSPRASLSLCLVRGDTYKHKITWVDASETPVDLTGASARLQVRKTITSQTVILEATSPTEIVLGDALGTIDLNLLPATTAAFAAAYDEDPVYDLEITLADGTVTTIMGGTIKLTPDVSHS